MTTLHLTPDEHAALRRALVAMSEAHDMDATSSVETAVLEGILERLDSDAGDQSRAPSRAPMREALSTLSADDLLDVIAAADDLLAERDAPPQRAGRREVSARYTSRRVS